MTSRHKLISIVKKTNTGRNVSHLGFQYSNICLSMSPCPLPEIQKHPTLVSTLKTQSHQNEPLARRCTDTCSVATAHNLFWGANAPVTSECLLCRSPRSSSSSRPSPCTSRGQPAMPSTRWVCTGGGRGACISSCCCSSSP